MRPDYQPSRKPGWFARLRFALWLAFRRVLGYPASSGDASDSRKGKD
jgi:hypothetical protein